MCNLINNRMLSFYYVTAMSCKVRSFLTTFFIFHSLDEAAGKIFLRTLLFRVVLL